MIADGIRVRVWHIYASSTRVISTPVNNFPGTLNFEASIWNNGEYFILRRNTKQFAIFSEESRLSIVSSTITNRHNNIVREAYEVVLLVVHNNSLGALARESVAVVGAEGADNRTFVTKRIKLGIVDAVGKAFLALVYFGAVQAAVIAYGSLAI